MGELYHWMIQAKQKNVDASVRILQQFEPKLKQCLYRTTVQERDDLRQELQIKILRAMEKFETQDIPGFFEYLLKLEDTDSTKNVEES